MSHKFTSCHIMSHHVTSCHITSHHVTSRHITSQHILYCNFTLLHCCYSLCLLCWVQDFIMLTIVMLCVIVLSIIVLGVMLTAFWWTLLCKLLLFWAPWRFSLCQHKSLSFLLMLKEIYSNVISSLYDDIYHNKLQWSNQGTSLW